MGKIHVYEFIKFLEGKQVIKQATNRPLNKDTIEIEWLNFLYMKGEKK